MARQVDRSIDSYVFMQASTLDGVLELKNEHFWTIAFGSYVSTE